MNELLSPGDTLGKYSIENVMGAGNIGFRYKAYDKSIHKSVAIETLNLKIAGNNSDIFKHQFILEITAATRCSHPNILTTYEYAEDKGIPFIAMEYVEGEILKKFLRDFIQFKIQDIIIIIQQVLAGLRYAHSKNVIHQNLNPGNIILLKRKQIKVSDFGFARISLHPTNKKSSLPRSAQGEQHAVATNIPNYLAPEQITGEEIHISTDLYATGLLLFELLAKSDIANISPYDTARLPPVNNGRINCDELDKYFPPEFSDILCTSLQDNPDRRFQSADEFSTAILRGYKNYLLTVKDLYKPINPDIQPPPDQSELAMPTSTNSSTENNYLYFQEQTRVEMNNPDILDFNQKFLPMQQQPSNIIWPEKVINQLSETLNNYVGPFSNMLVDLYSRTHTDIQSLIKALSTRIPDNENKVDFIQSALKLCEHASPMEAKTETPEKSFDTNT